MKKTFCGLVLVTLALLRGCQPAYAWTVGLSITNFDMTLATNDFRIYRAQENPFVDGVRLTLGSPVTAKNTNGFASKDLLAGNYELRIVGYSLPRPIYFAVPEGSGSNQVTELRISGVNFFKYSPGVQGIVMPGATTNNGVVTLPESSGTTYTNNTGYAGQIVGSGIGTNVNFVKEAAAQSVARNIGGVSTNLLLGSGSPSGFMDHVYIWTNGAYFQLQAAGTLGSYYLTNFSDLWWHSAGTFTGGLTSLTNDTLTGGYSAAAGPLNFVHIELGLNGLAIAPSSINTNSFDAATRALLGTGSGGGSSNYVDTLSSTNGFWTYATNSGRITATFTMTNIPGANVTGVVPNAATAGYVTNSALTNSTMGLTLTNNYKSYAAATFANATGSGYVTSGAAFGWAGWTFKPLTNIVVTHLARWISSTNLQTHTVAIVRTNDGALVASTQIDPSRYATNGFAYVELPQPVLLPASGDDVYYAIVSSEFENGDQYPQVTALTMNSRLRYGFGLSQPYFPYGYDGWTTVGYAVNFKFTEVISTAFGLESDSASNFKLAEPKHTFPSAVKADSFEGSAQDVHSQFPAVDLAKLKWSDPGGPTYGIDGYASYFGSGAGNPFGNGGLPNQTDAFKFAEAIRTNGALHNWNVYLPDDGWYWGHDTDRNFIITNFAQLQITGANYATNAYWVRSNGVLQLHPTNWPMGLSNFCAAMHTNRDTLGNYMKVRWYMPFRTNMNYLHKDITHFVQAGVDELMLDTTVGREGFFYPGKAIHEQKRILRTVFDASIQAQSDGRGRYFERPHRGLKLHMGLNAKIAGDGIDSSDTNTMFTAENIMGATAYILSGEDVSTTAGAYAKAKKTRPYAPYYGPHHYPDFLLMAWSASESTNVYRSKLNCVFSAGASLLINPEAFWQHQGAELHVLTNAEPYVYGKDPAGYAGYTTQSNGLKEVVWKPFGSLTSGTGTVYFVNLALTNFTHTLNVTNFGGVSNAVYYARDPWFKTNTSFINEWTFANPPTNNQMFVVWKAAASTNYYSPTILKVTGTQTSQLVKSSPSAAPHYINDGWNQSAASAGTFDFGVGIEPEVDQVIVTYQWVSGLSSGTVYWQDTWQTWFNSPVGRDAILPQTFTTNIFCVNAAVLETTVLIPMPATNAWKQLNFSAAASTNGNTRTMPFGLKVVKVKP